MIYTLTVNPSIDYHMVLEKDLTTGAINRSSKEMIYPGGKGINVSIMLGRLDTESIALGFLAGRTGEMLKGLLEDQGCRSDFVFLPEGETRINVKVDGTRRETALNGKGPKIPADAVGELIGRLETIREGDYIVISGNVPKDSLPICEAVYEAAASRKAKLVVDTEGEALHMALAYKPYLIAPNAEELCDLFETMASSKEQIVELMEKARQMGAENVLVSRGEKGAMLLTREGELITVKLTGRREPVSTVGAGDSLLAGFLSVLSQTVQEQADGASRDVFAKALRMGCAAGTATAMTTWLAQKSQVEKEIPEVQII